MMWFQKREGNYLDGSMEGEWISYSKDGIIVSKGEYVSSRKMACGNIGIMMEKKKGSPVR